jgi:hypothetical protein
MIESQFGIGHNKIERVPRPAYSPDIIEAITTTWNDAIFEELQRVFSEWIQRVTWVIEHGGVL